MVFLVGMGLALLVLLGCTWWFKPGQYVYIVESGKLVYNEGLFIIVGNLL